MNMVEVKDVYQKRSVCKTLVSASPMGELRDHTYVYFSIRQIL